MTPERRLDREYVEVLPDSKYKRKMLALLDAADELDRIREALRSVLTEVGCAECDELGHEGGYEMLPCSSCRGTGTRSPVDDPKATTLELVQMTLEQVHETAKGTQYREDLKNLVVALWSGATGGGIRTWEQTLARAASVARIAAETRERCAVIAEDERVIRAMPPYDHIFPRAEIGEYWPHAGFRIAAAIRAGGAAAT